LSVAERRAPTIYAAASRSIECAHGVIGEILCVTLQRSVTTIESLRRLLSAEELARADRFKFETDRRRYIAGRAALRQVLGRSLNTEPAAIEFTNGRHGKPTLAGAHRAAVLNFNLSNSHELAIIALCRGCEIGIDVEYIRTLNHESGLAKRYLSAGEFQAYQSRPKQDRTPMFFKHWTRTEAVVKALGTGLGFPRANVEGSPHWSLASFEPAAGYIAAIAIKAGGCQLIAAN
jgi:4'-phosphopantetheinyl transferase